MSMSRRSFLAGLTSCSVPLLAGCAERLNPVIRPAQYSAVPAPPPAAGNAATGLDAVIDINHSSAVTDFAQMRNRSRILAVIHKATEGGNWSDPQYRLRRPQAEAAGLMWGAYHFGTRQYSGAQQAAAFLALVQPGPHTVMALDLEPNEQNPQNTMTVAQAEEFVSAIYQATRRMPLIYTHPKWANGEPYGKGGQSLAQPIGPQSILASCDLWLADYRPTPEVPWAWSRRGWPEPPSPWS